MGVSQREQQERGKKKIKGVLSGSRPKTMPRMALESRREAPMIFTTLTLSTLKFLGLEGITERQASTTRGVRKSS